MFSLLFLLSFLFLPLFLFPSHLHSPLSIFSPIPTSTSAGSALGPRWVRGSLGPGEIRAQGAEGDSESRAVEIRARGRPARGRGQAYSRRDESTPGRGSALGPRWVRPPPPRISRCRHSLGADPARAQLVVGPRWVRAGSAPQRISRCRDSRAVGRARISTRRDSLGEGGIPWRATSGPRPCEPFANRAPML